MNDGCPFCNLNNENDIYRSMNVIHKDLVKYNRTLFFEGKYFSIIPDISPISAYHLLIVPIKHYNSIRETPSESKIELIKLKQLLQNELKDLTDNDVIFFEHGTCNNIGSACIAHAHLHCIPLSPENLKEVQIMVSRYLGEPDDVEENESYIYFEIGEEKKYWIDSYREKQFLRKIIATGIGRHNRITWQMCQILEEERIITSEWLKSAIEKIKLN